MMSRLQGPPVPRPGVALVALCLAFYVVQLDATVVNVALGSIRHDFDGRIDDQQWVIAAYTIVLAAGMLTAGALGDRVGAKRMCTLGLAVFGVASALCSAAPGMPWLIAARAVQGLGAAALLPCSLALIVKQFPDAAQRARALGVWGAVGSIGMATGPLVGGVLIAVWGWRAIFLVNLPVCAVTIVLIARFVVESTPDPERRLDIPGLLLGTVGLAAITGGLIEGGGLGWSRPLVIGLIVGGIAAAVAFVLVERLRRRPLLPLKMFASRPFSAGVLAGGIFNFNLYGTLLCLSLFLQGPLREPAWLAGLVILPLTVAVGVGATASGWLTARLGSRIPMLVGYALGAAGAAVLLLSSPQGPIALLLAGSLIFGFCSLAMPAMTSVVMNAAAPSLTGLASGVLNTARQTGGALGVAVLGALLAGGVPHLPLALPMTLVVLTSAAAIVCTLLATSSRAADPSTATPAPQPR